MRKLLALTAFIAASVSFAETVAEEAPDDAAMTNDVSAASLIIATSLSMLSRSCSPSVCMSNAFGSSPT